MGERASERRATAPSWITLPARFHSEESRESDDELGADPPLLQTRHSAYFDALQQLDEGTEARESEMTVNPRRRATKARPAPSLPALQNVLGWSTVSRVAAMVRGASPDPPGPASGAGARPDALPSTLRRSGEHARSSPGELRHRPSPEDPSSAPPAGMGKRSCSAEYSVGTENTTRGGHGRKIAAAGSASAFAFMSPEPFVAYDSMAARLRSILLTYSFFNFDLAYCQGMSDLAAPMLVVMEGDEVEAFWCFQKLMEDMEPNFHKDQNGMHTQLQMLQSLCAQHEPDLLAYLESKDCANL